LLNKKTSKNKNHLESRKGYVEVIVAVFVDELFQSRCIRDSRSVLILSKFLAGGEVQFLEILLLVVPQKCTILITKADAILKEC
jgi:hypothetical protein